MTEIAGFKSIIFFCNGIKSKTMPTAHHPNYKPTKHLKKAETTALFSFQLDFSCIPSIAAPSSKVSRRSYRIDSAALPSGSAGLSSVKLEMSDE